MGKKEKGRIKGGKIKGKRRVRVANEK